MKRVVTIYLNYGREHKLPALHYDRVKYIEQTKHLSSVVSVGRVRISI